MDTETLDMLQRLSTVACYGYPLHLKEDLRQEALIAGLKAMETWKPGGVQLSRWVWQYMRTKIRAVARMQNSAISDPAYFEAYKRAPISCCSLDATYDDGTPIRQLAQPEVEERAELPGLPEAIAQLPERLRYVIEQRLDGVILEDLGASLGVTRERARQLEAEAVALLQKHFRRKGLLGRK